MRNTNSLRLHPDRWPILVSLFILALLFSSCGLRNTATAQKKNKAIRTLIVGGGSSHDFDKWYKEVDSKTLERDSLASVIYTSDVTTIRGQLQNIDVLFLTNNQPMEDPELRKAIFAFVDSG